MDERNVVIVEDNDEHAELIEFVLTRTHPHARLTRYSDGSGVEQALAASAAEKLPHLVLLDLKLPCVSGIELLTRLRANERTRRLPIVMFTTSNSARDRDEALEARANAFIVKPMDFTALKARLETTFRFWLDHAVGH